MAALYYDPDPAMPGTGTLTDDRGKKFTVLESDVPNVKTLPPSASLAPVLSVGAVGAPLSSVVPPQAPPAAAQLLSNLDKVTRKPSAPVGMVPTSMIVQPGIPMAQIKPLLDARTASAENTASALEEQGANRTAREQGVIQNQAASNVGQFFDNQAELNRKKEELKENNALQAQLRDEKDEPIDPDRYINSLSTGKSIGMIILAAINGAFKAALGQSGNDVMQLVENRIQQDIAAQKEQLQSGRIRRGNKLDGLVRMGLSVEQAVNVLERAAKEHVARSAELSAQMIGTPEAAEQGKLLAQQARDSAKLQNASDVLNLGTDRKSITMARPVAADTDEAELKKLQLEKARSEARAAEIDAKTAEDISKDIGIEISPKRLEKIRENVVQIRPAIAELEPLMTDLENAVRFVDPEAKVNKETGKVTWSGKDLKGVGPVDRATGRAFSFGGLNQTEAGKLDTLTGRITQRVTQELTGANSSLKQDTTFQEMSGARTTLSEKAFKDSLEHTLEEVANKKNAHVSSLGRDGKAYYRLGERPSKVTGVIQ